MKTTPPAGSAPEQGTAYWRSLDQLSDTPEFRQWLDQEFPAGSTDWKHGVTRRDFVQLMSASLALAGVGILGSGCRKPVEQILPFSRMPEGYVHGVPQYFATAMPTRASAVPVVVRSNDGRPTKIEPNEKHPHGGGADTFTQASVLSLYDPDRAQRFTRGGHAVGREAVLDFLASEGQRLAQAQGQGLCFLLEHSSSPTRARLQAALSRKFPQAGWFSYEAINLGVHDEVLSHFAGRNLKARHHLEQARVILSLDCDFIGAEEDTYIHCRGFALGRKIVKPGDPMNRLYQVEPLMSQTGMNADHRLRVPAGAVLPVTAAIAAQILPNQAEVQALAQRLGLPSGIKPEWITQCAKDLVAHPETALVMAGHRQPVAVHVLAYLMNQALRAINKTVVYLESDQPGLASIQELAQRLNAGQVDTLVILGGNPVYNAPGDFNWPALQARAKNVIRLGYYEDETAALAAWHLPAAHYLESWGDARTADGILVPIQPLIEPLFGGLTEIEVLARLGGLEVTNPYELVRETFRGQVPAEKFEDQWRLFLHDGFLANSEAKPAKLELNAAALGGALNAVQPPAAVTRDSLEVIWQRDYRVDDGRFSNNGWLQELPDPVTKLTWENAILVSRKTAEEFKLANGQVVEIALAGRSLKGPIWIQPGQADYVLGLSVGYGRTRSGRVGNFKGQARGYNAYVLRSIQMGYFAAGATIKPAGPVHHFACTQDHWSMEGRPIIREGTLKQFIEDPEFAKGMDFQDPPVKASLYPNPLDQSERDALHQWGMSIDLNACVGCSACVIACQSENNVPIVGPEQVARGREMHWLRIDRYYSGDPALPLAARVDDPQVVNQPMLCQHCEAAPCENVCPVNATVHDEEGLNVMVYNRCVGTRYCSNNCPYKVRRFNYFDYNKRPLEDLYAGPLAVRKHDEWELLKLVKNPDVTVRMRGVMEKCTFCLQRIEQAKIARKVQARASSDVVVPDGVIKTACQQACPAEAIVFGNVADPNSAVAQQKKQPRDYSVLDFLFTRPRLTYLARVRNPNPAMPDAYDVPLTTREFRAGGGMDHGSSSGGAPSHGAAPGGHTTKGGH